MESEAEASTPLLDVKDLAVRYPTGELALYNVSFQVKKPSFTAVIGPNGSGKSTLIKTLIGLLKPLRGYARVNGHDSVRESKVIRKMIRYIPQRDHIDLTVPMKVKDIVLMGRLLKKSPPRFASKNDREKAKTALQRVDMLDLWDRPFPELSGGQRQRVLVARALASEGSLLILDEPFAGTDAESQDLIVEALGEYKDNDEVSVIIVTHDLNPIHLLVQDVLLLRNTLVGLGTPCEMMDPEILKELYGPGAKVVEYGGHRYCITHDSGVDRHD